METNTKKEKLIILSIKARELRDQLAEKENDPLRQIAILGRTINSIILEFYYSDENNQEFNTYNQWKEKGFQVKKGETAFVIWGKKRGNKQDNETDDKDDYTFFPLAYLFSNAQIEPIKDK